MEFVLVALFVLYLSPWVLAEAIEHRHAGTIGVLTCGLGWTGIGWALAMGWVVRDWPRTPAPPKLIVLRPGERLPRSPWPRRVLGSLLLGAGCAGLMMAATQDAWRSGGEPAWSRAETRDARVALRRGPGEAWAPLGSVGPRCPVRVLERRGAWRRVWRLDACDGAPSERSGWVRQEALRGVEAEPPLPAVAAAPRRR